MLSLCYTYVYAENVENFNLIVEMFKLTEKFMFPPLSYSGTFCEGKL